MMPCPMCSEITYLYFKIIIIFNYKCYFDIISDFIRLENVANIIALLLCMYRLMTLFHSFGPIYAIL